MNIVCILVSTLATLTWATKLFNLNQIPWDTTNSTMASSSEASWVTTDLTTLSSLFNVSDVSLDFTDTTYNSTTL